MADDTRKREASCSPAGSNDREKMMREQSPPLQVNDHVSVIDIAEMQPSSAPPSISQPATGSTPTGKKTITRRNLLSPENLDYFSMIENLKTPLKVDSKNISNELLYSMILGLESRVFELEKHVTSLETENTDLKQKLENVETLSETNVDDISQVKQDLAEASDGIATLEAFRDECNMRLDNLELPLEELNEGTAMQTGELANTSASDRVQQIQRDLDQHISNMTTFTTNIQKENRRRHLECDHQEQYTRRDCIIVKGVHYKRGEDTTDLVCRIAYSIGVNISASDISTSHRTGRQMGDTPRPIICRFTRRDTKYRVMANRREARHIQYDDEGNPVRIYIDENLTQMRARVCKKLRDGKTPHKVKDGKIHLLSAGENPTTLQILDSPSDWEGLTWPDHLKIELGIYPRD